MVTTNKKKSLITLLLIGVISISIAAIKPTPPGKFKNLKVLPKDISEDSLDTVMHHFKDALGVKCDFCHVKDANDPKHLDFASDDKDEKEIARHMMRMTMDINAKYFNFKNLPDSESITTVTCNTCHRGEAHPEGKDDEEDKDKKDQ